VTAAMDLFGRQGYQATSVAQLEAAAGLSAGAGGLYRHFPSKRAVLEEGLRRQAAAGRGLIAFIEDPGLLSNLPPRERLLAVARAGLRRLEEERDLNRLLLRDLSVFPDLLEQVKNSELRRVFDAVAGWLRGQAAEQAAGQPEVDWDAVAAVLMAAVSHYWIMRDVYSGVHPHGISEDRFLAAAADLASRLFPSPGAATSRPAS